MREYFDCQFAKIVTKCVGGLAFPEPFRRLVPRNILVLFPRTVDKAVAAPAKSPRPDSGVVPVDGIVGMIVAKLLLVLAISAAPWHRPTCAPALNHRTTEMLRVAGVRCLPGPAPVRRQSVEPVPAGRFRVAALPPSGAAAR